MTDPERRRLLREAISHLRKTTKGWLDEPVGKGTEWTQAMAMLRELERDLMPPAWANIGPLTKPGISVLDMSLTHKTSGIPLFPAVDFAWGPHIPIYAPEGVVIDTKDTSANPGNAVYMTGRSKLRYWLGHIDRDHPIGKRFAKGALLARTIDQPPNATDHGHLGVNAEAYLGKGKQLKYGRTGLGPDYTTGSPTIRKQLEALLL